MYDLRCILKDEDAGILELLPNKQSIHALATSNKELKHFEQQMHILFVITSTQEIVTINAAEIASHCGAKNTEKALVLPDQHGRSDMLVQIVNRLPFLGKPSDYYVTNNGQYVFATITRKNLN